MEPGKLIGKGMTSEVFEWGDNRVLKLFFKRFGYKRVEYEADIGYAVHEAGVISPAVCGIEEVNDCKGIVFERIFGKTILNQIRYQPWLISYYAKQMAELHFKMHNCHTERLPSQINLLYDAIEETDEIDISKKNRILSYLESLPRGNSVCHGDLHFENIIVSEEGLIPIDWAKAYKGNPMGDVARTCMTIRSPTMPFGTSNLLMMSYLYGKLYTYREYLNEYMRIANVTFEDIDAWTLPVAAARLKEKIPGEREWIIGIIEDYLERI